MVKLNDLGFDSGPKTPAPRIKFQDALPVCLDGSRGEDAAGLRQHNATQDLTGNAPITFKGHAIDLRIFHDIHDNPRAFGADGYIAEQAGCE